MQGASSGRLQWSADDELVVDGVEFGLRPGIKEPFDSTADRFCLCKARWAVEALDELVAGLEPRRAIEVGVKQGGGAALLSRITDLEKLVGIELNPEPVEALASFAAARDLERTLAIHYGVDQADSAALAAIADDEFGGEPVDLVIDDASHMLAESRITFDALFPLLRPGGVYLLEDWSWAHMSLPVWPRREPLTTMVFELIVACGHSPEVVAQVDVNRGWAVVRRGPGEIEDDFALSRLYGERGRQLLPAPGSGVEVAPRPSGLRARASALRGKRR